MYEKRSNQDSCVRDSFVFYAGFYDALEDIHGEEFEECVRAVMNYALKGELLKASGSAKMYLTMAKPQIDANNRKYLNGKNNKQKSEQTQEASSEKNNEQQKDSADFLHENSKASSYAHKNGTKDGDFLPKHKVKGKQAHTKAIPNMEQDDTKPTPKGEQDDTEAIPNMEQDDTKAIPKGEQDITKVHPNVNDNVNDNDNDNDNENVHVYVNEKENINENSHCNVNVYVNEGGGSVKGGASFSELEEQLEAEDENETHTHGEYKNVLLSSLERKKLNFLLGEELAAKSIEHLSRYLRRKKDYKSSCHFEDLRGWVQDSLKKATPATGAINKSLSEELKMKRLREAGFLDLTMEQLYENCK